jgi:hypothetical protein
MFGSTYGFTFNLRAAFSSAGGACPALPVVTAVVQKAFDNLDWDCQPNKEGLVLYGATSRLPPWKERTVAEKIVGFLDPVWYTNSFLHRVPDSITWTFSEGSHAVIADVHIFISKGKMRKSEAKEKLSNVTNTLLNEVTRCGGFLGLKLSVAPAADK